MKHLPNILSASRIALCLPLLLADAMTVSFWVLYVIAGTGLVALVKIVNAISSYLVRQRIEFLHTIANKLTGFLLFIGMMTIGQSYFIPVAWVIACIALFAAIQEGHIIRSK